MFLVSHLSKRLSFLHNWQVLPYAGQCSFPFLCSVPRQKYKSFRLSFICPIFSLQNVPFFPKGPLFLELSGFHTHCPPLWNSMLVWPFTRCFLFSHHPLHLHHHCFMHSAHLSTLPQCQVLGFQKLFSPCIIFNTVHDSVSQYPVFDFTKVAVLC